MTYRSGGQILYSSTTGERGGHTARLVIKRKRSFSNLCTFDKDRAAAGAAPAAEAAAAAAAAAAEPALGSA